MEEAVKLWSSLSPLDKVTIPIAAATLSMPAWYERLVEISAIAALLAPIVSVTWITILISMKIIALGAMLVVKREKNDRAD